MQRERKTMHKFLQISLPSWGMCILSKDTTTKAKLSDAKEGFVDSASLVANADLVVSYGGTIAREAALQGVPSIAISDMAKTYVNTYLTKKGFPLFATTERGVLSLCKEISWQKIRCAKQACKIRKPC